MTDEKEPVYEMVKLSNPLWIGNIAEKVVEYVKAIDDPTVTYESVYTYFCNVVQFGGDQAEFHIMTRDGEPIGFASWRVLGLPAIGTVLWDHVHGWDFGTEDAPVRMQMATEHAKQYARKMNARNIALIFASEARLRYWKHHVMEQCGLKFVQEPKFIPAIVREK